MVLTIPFFHKSGKKQAAIRSPTYFHVDSQRVENGQGTARNTSFRCTNRSAKKGEGHDAGNPGRNTRDFTGVPVPYGKGADCATVRTSVRLCKALDCSIADLFAEPKSKPDTADSAPTEAPASAPASVPASQPALATMISSLPPDTQREVLWISWYA